MPKLIPKQTSEKLVQAALDSVVAIEACYPVMEQMELPNDERTNVALALLYASLEQARSASFLVAHDVEQSVFGALVLLRSQIDQLMRAAFFAGPASTEQLTYFLEKDKLPKHEGEKMGPKSLSRINTNFFGWPADRVPDLVDYSWSVLCGVTHGGRALLNYYIHEDGIGPYPATDEFVPMLSNAVSLTSIVVTTALYMAANQEAEKLQQALHAWDQTSREYFAKWTSNATVAAAPLN